MKPVALALCVLTSMGLYAQIIQESGSLQNVIENHIAQMPGDSGNAYSEPSVSQLEAWRRTIAHLQNEDFALAALSADSIQYELVHFEDTVFSAPSTYYLLRDNASNHWGYYVYFPTHCRSLVIQAPHPLHDFNTGKQGVHVFQRTRAAWLFISGTHRCNHSQFSICDGTTSVCSGNSESFRISDLAHDVNNLFHQATEVTAELDTSLHYIQLHGFTKQSTDPYLILSNGSPFTPTTDKLLQFSVELGAIDTSLTFKIAHIDTSWTRLRGFTNTQGRYLNGSFDPCDDNPNTTSGRFFHVEQEKSKLRNDSIGWNKIASALNNVFACQSTISYSENTHPSHKIYPNPTTGILYIDQLEPNEPIEVFNVHGQPLNAAIHREGERATVDLTGFPSGLYLIKIENEVERVINRF